MRIYRIFKTDDGAAMIETSLLRDMYSYRSFTDWCKSIGTCYFIRRRTINKFNKMNK